jgi:hypothetical protein
MPVRRNVVWIAHSEHDILRASSLRDAELRDYRVQPVKKKQWRFRVPACHRQRSCLCQTGRYAASPFRWYIHRYWLYLGWLWGFRVIYDGSAAWCVGAP